MNPSDVAQNTDFDFLFKLLLIGDCGVGKSALLQRFSDDTFDISYISTIGVDFKIRRVQQLGKSIKLQIWDTAGQERFRTITSSYYRGSHGIMIVYDSTDESSFRRVKYWLDEVERYVGRERTSLILVANKCDLTTKRAVATAQGQQLANEIGARFYEVSAKTSAGVEIAFNALAEDCLVRLGLPDSRWNNTKNENVSVQPFADVGRTPCTCSLF